MRSSADLWCVGGSTGSSSDSELLGAALVRPPAVASFGVLRPDAAALAAVDAAAAEDDDEADAAAEEEERMADAIELEYRDSRCSASPPPPSTVAAPVAVAFTPVSSLSDEPPASRSVCSH